MNPIRVAIVEDVEEYRNALQYVLNSTPGFECVLTYSNGLKALEDIPKHLPDVVLVDLNIPGINGIEVMRQLKPKVPKIQFMVLTVSDDDEKIFAALSAGANGYLLKSTMPNEILEAVQDVYNGGSPMSATIARKVVDAFRNPTPQMHNPYEELLTQREKEVLALLAKGKLYKQIADELHISLETVKSHCHNIYDKLHVKTRTEAIIKYFPPAGNGGR